MSWVQYWMFGAVTRWFYVCYSWSYSLIYLFHSENLLLNSLYFLFLVSLSWKGTIRFLLSLVCKSVSKSMIFGRSPVSSGNLWQSFQTDWAAISCWLGEGNCSRGIVTVVLRERDQAMGCLVSVDNHKIKMGSWIIKGHYQTLAQSSADSHNQLTIRYLLLSLKFLHTKQSGINWMFVTS